MENIQYDIIVLGANSDGMLAAITAKLAFPGKKVCILAKSFAKFSDDDLTELDDYGIGTYAGEVKLLTYYHGMIILSLGSNNKALCQRLILATGTRPEEYWVGDKVKTEYKNNLYTDLAKMYYDCTDKDFIAVASTGSDSLALTAATKLAAKCHCVYVFLDKMESTKNKTLTAKVNKLHKEGKLFEMHNSHITKVLNDPRAQNSLFVQLDTYTGLSVDKVLAVVGTEPDIAVLPQNFYDLDEAGYIVVNDNCALPKVPAIMLTGKLLHGKTQQEVAYNIYKLY